MKDVVFKEDPLAAQWEIEAWILKEKAEEK